MAPLLDMMFTNKIDRFTDHDEASKVFFESVYLYDA